MATQPGDVICSPGSFQAVSICRAVAFGSMLSALSLALSSICTASSVESPWDNGLDVVVLLDRADRDGLHDDVVQRRIVLVPLGLEERACCDGLSRSRCASVLLREVVLGGPRALDELGWEQSLDDARQLGVLREEVRLRLEVPLLRCASFCVMLAWIASFSYQESVAARELHRTRAAGGRSLRPTTALWADVAVEFYTIDARAPGRALLEYS
eukprot:3361358-Prymnesium_polylepis.1